MAVAILDNSGNSSSAIATTNSFTMTISSGSNRVLVAPMIRDTTATVTVTSVVWDPTGANQALTLIREDNNASGTPSGAATSWWGLVNPTAGTSKILKATFSASCGSYLGGATFTGANQTGGASTFAHATGRTATADTTTSSFSVTSAVGDAVVAVFNASGSSGGSFNGTTIFNNFSNNHSIGGGANEAAGAASVTMTATWTGGNAANTEATGVDIVAAASGPPTGWETTPQNPIFTKPVFTGASSFTPQQPPAQPATGWKPSRDQPFYTKPVFTMPPAFAPQAFTPAMSYGWQATRDQPFYRKPQFTDAPAFGQPPPVLSYGWHATRDQPFYTKPKITDPPSSFIPPPVSAQFGWVGLSQDSFSYDVAFTDPPAFIPLPLTFPVNFGWVGLSQDAFSYDVTFESVAPAFSFRPTAAVVVANIGWFNPPDQPVYIKPRTTEPIAFTFRGSLVPVSGIGWFEPPDQPVYTKPKFSEPSSLFLQPAPVVKFGWVGLSQDSFSYDVIYESIASSFVGAPAAAAVTAVPFGWFNPPDQPLYPAKTYAQVEAYTTRPIAPFIPIAGISWMIASDTFLPRRTPSWSDIAPAWCPQFIAPFVPQLSPVAEFPTPFGAFHNFGRMGSSY